MAFGFEFEFVKLQGFSSFEYFGGGWVQFWDNDEPSTLISMGPQSLFIDSFECSVSSCISFIDLMNFGSTFEEREQKEIGVFLQICFNWLDV